MSREYVQIDQHQFDAMAAADTTGELQPWRATAEALHAGFRLSSFSAAAAFAASIAVVADRLDHHPDLDVRFPGVVRVVVSTHVTGGLTLDDVETARAVSRLAVAMGASGESSAG